MPSAAHLLLMQSWSRNLLLLLLFFFALEFTPYAVGKSNFFIAPISLEQFLVGCSSCGGSRLVVLWFLPLGNENKHLTEVPWCWFC